MMNDKINEELKKVNAEMARRTGDRDMDVGKYNYTQIYLKMLRLFDGEMFKYTYFKIVHGQCLQEKKFHCYICWFFCFVLGNFEAQENKTNCFPPKQALNV